MDGFEIRFCRSRAVFRTGPLLLILVLFLICSCAHQSRPVRPDSLASSDDTKFVQTKTVPHLDAQADRSNGSVAQGKLDEALGFCEASQDFWEQGDFDNAISSLDKAYRLILTIGSKNNPEMAQQKADIRYLISKRLLEIYASRHTVLAGKHDAIPLDLNKEVQKEIDRYLGGHRRVFIRAYRRSGKYRPKILKALQEAGLPAELSWLPLVESGYKVKAFSKARALGLWQFIPSTGYRFGLKRNHWIDERMDVEKSTSAAVAYLQELHRIFGDWCTVLAAYNCGENRVLRLIRQQHIKYLDNFWDLYAKLPAETRSYVPRFLAVLSIVNNPQKYGFDPKDIEVAERVETISVSKPVWLSEISKVLAMNVKDLTQLNPELRRLVTPPVSYSLRVPVGKAKLLAASLDSLPTYSPPRLQYTTHKICSGETLSHLARRYHSSVKAIAAANRIDVQTVLRLGQKLKIPQKASTPTSHAVKRVQNSKVSTTSYRVKRGDSLWLLAERFQTTVQDIRRFNGLTGGQLRMGQEIKIPKDVHGARLIEGTKSYQVRQGDSPYKIAIHHDMELEKFLRINRLTPDSTIYPGQRVIVDNN